MFRSAAAWSGVSPIISRSATRASAKLRPKSWRIIGSSPLNGIASGSVIRMNAAGAPSVHGVPAGIGAAATA